MTLAGRTKRPSYYPAAPKGAPLPPLEGVLVLLDAQLVQGDVVGLLLPDVLRDRGLVQPDGRHVVALGPEVPVAELVLEVGVPVEHHERALALEVAHEAGHADLGRYADQNVDVVGLKSPKSKLPTKPNATFASPITFSTQPLHQAPFNKYTKMNASILDYATDLRYSTCQITDSV